MIAFNYFVFVQDLPSPVSKTEGGLLLSNAHKQDIRFIEASVLSVGPLVEGLKEGDLVIYDKHSASDTEHKGQSFKVIKAQDIAGINGRKEDTSS